MSHSFHFILNAVIRWKNSSINRKIFGATILLTGLTLSVKAVALLKEIIVAAYFGIGSDLDAFTIALAAPGIISNIIGLSLSLVVIPIYVQTYIRDGQVAAQRIFSGAIVLGISLLIVSATLLTIFSPYLLTLIASGFDSPKLLLTQRLFYILLPGIVLTSCSQILAGILNAGESFILAALTPGLMSLASIALVIILSNKLGVYTLAWGVLIGAALECFILGFVLYKRGIYFQINLNYIFPVIQQIWHQFLPMASGIAILTVSNLIDQAFASTLPNGSVAALNYGNKIVALILTLSVSSIATAIIPYASQLVAEEKWSTLRHTLIFYTYRLILPVTIGVVVILVGFSDFIIRILYERGEFTAKSTQLVGAIQALYALQIPFYVIWVIGVRVTSALKINRSIFIISSICLIMNIALDYLLINLLGVSGIALATTIIAIISAILVTLNISIFLHKRLTLTKS